jgi:hypothetical protein
MLSVIREDEALKFEATGRLLGQDDYFRETPTAAEALVLAERAAHQGYWGIRIKDTETGQTWTIAEFKKMIEDQVK